MSYQVLARKWRPANFAEMVGQTHVLQALINALDSDRLHHAYLFSGTRGVGKTTIARIFAKSLNCDTGVSSKPCGECPSCQEVDQGRSVDLIEIDAASRTGVDDMRELLDNVQYAPTRGRFKIYLIDEVHMLSRHSFNALLKTLEEPPPHVKFLLATTDPQKVPVTVLSRCLQFNLKRMSRQQIQQHLQFLLEQEQVSTDAPALAMIASAADGSMRDALSLLDQAIAYGAGAVQQSAVESMLGSISRDYLLKLLDALVAQDANALIAEARNIIANNPDYQRICAELVALLQQMALYKSDSSIGLDDDMFGEKIVELCASWSMAEIQLYYQIMLQGRQDLKISPDEAAGFEMLMLRLLAFSPDIDSVTKVQAEKKKPVIHQAEVVAVSQPKVNELEAQAEDIIAVEPEAPQANSCQPSEDSLQWSQFAYQLGLQGLAQEIAVNSVVDSFRDNRLCLKLSAELKDIVTPAIEQEIKSAIDAKLGISCRLELMPEAGLTDETPHQARIRQQEDHRKAAISVIKESNLVKKLNRAFGVELVESSVKKLED